ncbi:hypothetical protein [Nakamurella multipartita]|uniref:Uncharacterized protein n=1 Tax=Nakamurella multipartita (strain ATCC 700099 / DSM 44233 / CIP 104796 / JCM 9543 / NBRC 105858 / Y-104) TaxID=479431 RepID=C8XIE2_NAKMY|nr:hypothetical protein [Nakamurella multipartita]ACV80407.1 hypothetical protein Namu_4118 [Nakamurella multipartita DSM 44233]
MRSGLLMMLALLTLVLGGAGSAALRLGAAAPPPAAADESFDPDQVTADLLSNPVVVLPGSIARFDRSRIAALTANGQVKLLVAPPGPIDSDANTGYRRALRDVAQAVEEQWDGTVVRVVGVEVESVGQDGLDDIRHLLTTFEVTSELEFITPYLAGGATGPSTDERVDDRTDPGLLADLTDRLRAHPVVLTDGAVAADPSAAVTDPELVRQSWQDTTGTSLRLVVRPPLADGEPAGVSAADLAAAFPDETVVLLQGRWLDVAGSDQATWTVARDMTLSRYEDFLQSRQVGPTEIVRVLGAQYAELTSGAVQDQPAPVQRNPVSWLLLILPWLALLLVVVFGLRHRSRRRARRIAVARHEDVALLAGAAAELPEVAAGILALDGLARSGPSQDRLTTATMQYRSARRCVADRRDAAAAAAAVRSARTALTEAADLLGVPNVPGRLTRADAGVGE